MASIVLIVLLLLVLGCGGGYFGVQRWDARGIGIFGLILIILGLFYVFGASSLRL